MLFIDNPKILLDFDELLPSKNQTFHENMNIIARGIILLSAGMAVYSKNYAYYTKQGFIALFILAMLIHLIENSRDIQVEGLSPTRITPDTHAAGGPVVHQAPAFEEERGAQFFRQSNPFQGPRPQPNKKKISGLYFDSF